MHSLDSRNKCIDLALTPRVLVRELVYNGKRLKMMLVDATGKEINIAPFTIETANTVFVDCTMELTKSESGSYVLCRMLDC